MKPPASGRPRRAKLKGESTKNKLIFTAGIVLFSLAPEVRVEADETNRFIRFIRLTENEVALEYDPLHDLAVLLWPPRFERDIRPHLLRLDVETVVGNARSKEKG